MLELFQPTFLLLDMRMPVVDGWELARQTKERGIDVPVIVMGPESQARQWAEEIGAAGFLTKPDRSPACSRVSRFPIRTTRTPRKRATIGARLTKARSSCMAADAALNVQAQHVGEHKKGRGRVLVIEDDEHLREVMETLISLRVASPGRQPMGEKRLISSGTWQPDLILLDLYMPGMDGREFLRTYRQTTGHQAPVILLTGRTETEGSIAELGVAGSLPKPFDVTEFLDMVAQLTECSEAWRNPRSPLTPHTPIAAAT
jgi:CheY-like chemotaxis protein